MRLLRLKIVCVMTALALLAPLALLVLYFGVQPNAILAMSQASVDAMLKLVQSGVAGKLAALAQ